MGGTLYSGEVFEGLVGLMAFLEVNNFLVGRIEEWNVLSVITLCLPCNHYYCNKSAFIEICIKGKSLFYDLFVLRWVPKKSHY